MAGACRIPSGSRRIAPGIAIFAWRLDQATEAFYIGGVRFRQRSSQEAADAESRRQGNREIAIDNYEVQIERSI